MDSNRFSWWILIILSILIDPFGSSSFARENLAPLAIPSDIFKVASQKLSLKASGGIYLYDYEPVSLKNADRNFEIYAAILRVEKGFSRLLFHVEGRYREVRLRPHYPDNVWLEEAYLSYELGSVNFKAGRFYNQFGLFWDGSFFGNLAFFDGYKLDPDDGLALGGGFSLADVPFTYTLQAFTDSLGENHVNGAFPLRSTEDRGDKEYYTLNLRLSPSFKTSSERLDLGFSSRWQKVKLGLGGQKEHNFSIGLDFRLNNQRREIYGEFFLRKGRISEVWPEDRGSERTVYGEIGFRRHLLGCLSVYLDTSWASYLDKEALDLIIQPGLSWVINPFMTAILEFDHFRHHGSKDFQIDRSLNLVLYFHI